MKKLLITLALAIKLLAFTMVFLSWAGGGIGTLFLLVFVIFSGQSLFGLFILWE